MTQKPGSRIGPLGNAVAWWIGPLLDLFFPKRCAGCGREGAFLCGQCIALLEPLEPPWCATCGLPLPQGAPCRSCQETPLSLEGIRSLYAYQHPLREALLQFKYHGVRAVGAELAVVLARYVTAYALPADLLVPVPLFSDRRRQRGYNQAEVLAEELSRRAPLPCVPKALRRVRHTPPQARLASRAERFANVAGAFAADQHTVLGKRVLLIDDVCTTGATLSACGAALRTAGAATVWGLTVAREL
jgi:ComF family protein